MKYNQAVRVKEGFFAGMEGVLVDEREEVTGEYPYTSFVRDYWVEFFPGSGAAFRKWMPKGNLEAL